MFLVTFLFVIGLAFIIIEFGFPGGIPALMGICFCLSSLWVVFQNFSTFVLFIVFTIELLVIFGAIKFTLFRLKKSKTNEIYLSKDQQSYLACSFNTALIGKKGIALTDLRLSGFVQIENESYTAVSKQEYIQEGEEIEVISGQGGYVIVRKLWK